MKEIPFLLLSFLICFSSCDNNKSEVKNENSDTSTVIEKKEDEVSLVKIWETDTVLTTCESVLFDKERNIIYVSNINGGPGVKDNNGFISKLSVEGKVENLQWVTGLSAPKGMGIVNGKLYVTDISVLVEIDIEKGKIIQRYEVPEAKFLNDVAAGEDGAIYFSDSETGKIHAFKNGNIEVWKQEFLRPNGLLVLGNKLFLATSGSSDFRVIDMVTKEDSIIAKGIGAGDGVVSTGNEGVFIVSNWQGEVFYIERDGAPHKILDTKEQKLNSADIDYIREKNLLLVPTFFGNKVEAYEVK